MSKLNLKSKYKIDAQFSMSSMTDIVFLLLIFFMITTSFETIEGINVNLPSSNHSKTILKSINISITENETYYIENKQLTISELAEELKHRIINIKGIPNVLIEADKNVSLDSVVKAANIASALNTKISIATKQ